MLENKLTNTKKLNLFLRMQTSNGGKKENYRRENIPLNRLIGNTLLNKTERNKIKTKKKKGGIETIPFVCSTYTKNHF